MNIILDEKMLRRLLQLCHPDRHQGSEASHVATKWLLSVKDGRETASNEFEPPPFRKTYRNNQWGGRTERKDVGFEVRCQILQKTEKAVLVSILDTDQDMWFPKSQIITQDDGMDAVGATGSIWVTEWIAKQKGLI